MRHRQCKSIYIHKHRERESQKFIDALLLIDRYSENSNGRIIRQARPTYPKEWYSMLADRTSNHSLDWDVGTGNGQAAIGVAEHYEQVIGTDVSKGQLKYALPHPKVRYIHTPLSMSDDELVTSIGDEGSVDLITVAQAVHWFDLPRFYSVVTRLLRKPGGVLALWGYKDIKVSPTFDAAGLRWFQTTLPCWNSKVQQVHDDYRTLPFPFESVGLGSEGNPLLLDIPKEVSFEGYLGFLRLWSAVVSAKEQGVDLLPEEWLQSWRLPGEVLN